MDMVEGYPETEEECIACGCDNCNQEKCIIRETEELNNKKLQDNMKEIEKYSKVKQMTENKFKSAKETKKVQAERPFSLYTLRDGRQFTVTENLQTTLSPRVSVKAVDSKKDGKHYDFPIALLKVTDGTFEKDMELSEVEWRSLSIALPDGLLNWSGVVMTYDGNKATYLGIAAKDSMGNLVGVPSSNSPDMGIPKDVTNEFSKPSETPQDASGQEISQKDKQSYALSEAIKTMAIIGTPCTAAITVKLADNIAHGQAIELITYAKQKGDIQQGQDGLYKGTQ